MTLFGFATTADRLAVDPGWLCVGLNTPTFGDPLADRLLERFLTVRERVSPEAIVLRGTLTLLLTDGRSTTLGRAGSAGRAGAERDGRDTYRGLPTGDTPGIFGAVGRGRVTLFRLGARWI